MDAFKHGYQTSQAAAKKLADGLTHPELKRLIADSGKHAAAFAKAFDEYATLSLALDTLIEKTMGEEGSAIQNALNDIVASQVEATANLNRAIVGTMSQTSTTMMAIAIGALAVSLLVATLIARGIVRPVSGLTAGMKEPAAGNFAVVLPGLDRRHEVDEMAQAVATFKVKAAETARLEVEERQAAQAREAEARRREAEREAAQQRAGEEKAAAERKAAMHRLADEEIGGQIAGMQTATNESVSAIKEISGTIAHISEIAATIAAAVEEQGAATQEIARNVQKAAQGTGEVASNIASVDRGAGETGSASSQVLRRRAVAGRREHPAQARSPTVPRNGAPPREHPARPVARPREPIPPGARGFASAPGRRRYGRRDAGARRPGAGCRGVGHGAAWWRRGRDITPSLLRGRAGGLRQIRSITMASPWPTPTHIAHSA